VGYQALTQLSELRHERQVSWLAAELKGVGKQRRNFELNLSLNVIKIKILQLVGVERLCRLLLLQ